MAPLFEWLTRAAFLILLYGFLFRLYRALLTGHLLQEGEGQARRAPSASSDSAAIVLLSTGAPGGIWLEDGSSRGRRLHVGDRTPVGRELHAGRSEGNRLRIDDPFVSGRHFVIGRDGSGYYVEDRRTTNGTRVDGRPVEGRRPLYPGSVIEIGGTRFRFEVNAPR